MLWVLLTFRFAIYSRSCFLQESSWKYIPQTDVVIELGGEDAKIIYFDKSIEQRMNGTCAGGTGAFIDQMASLLHTDPTGLNELAKIIKWYIQ